MLAVGLLTQNQGKTDPHVLDVTLPKLKGHSSEQVLGNRREKNEIQSTGNFSMPWPLIKSDGKTVTSTKMTLFCVCYIKEGSSFILLSSFALLCPNCKHFRDTTLCCSEAQSILVGNVER